MHLRLADEAPTPLLALAALELALLLLALRFPKSLPEVGFVMVTLLALSYVKKDLWRQLFSETTASGTAPLERASLDSRRLAHRNAQSLFLEMLLLLAVNVAASFVKFAPGIAEACSVTLIADAVRSLVLQPSATPQDCSKLFASREPGAGRGIRLCQAPGLGHDNSSTLLLSNRRLQGRRGEMRSATRRGGPGGAQQAQPCHSVMPGLAVQRTGVWLSFGRYQGAPGAETASSDSTRYCGGETPPCYRDGFGSPFNRKSSACQTSKPRKASYAPCVLCWHFGCLLIVSLRSRRR